MAIIAASWRSMLLAVKAIARGPIGTSVRCGRISALNLVSPTAKRPTAVFLRIKLSTFLIFPEWIEMLLGQSWRVEEWRQFGYSTHLTGAQKVGVWQQFD